MKDCFFYTAKIDEQILIVPMCLDCKKNHPDLGWFWEGSRRGYGPFVFTCGKCNCTIYEPKEEPESNE